MTGAPRTEGGPGRMQRTIFERYGGFARISRLVSAFYGKVLDSPVTGPYFAGIDMRRMVDHQTKFVASVMGGPASFADDVLERVHAPLAVTPEAFAEMVALLRETLEDFDFEDEDVRAVCDAIVRRRHLIVGGR